MNFNKIDFAPFSFYSSLNRFSPLSFFFTWLILLCSCHILWKFYLISQEQIVLDENIRLKSESLTKRHHEIPKIKAEKISLEKITAVNRAVDQLNMPWSDMLDSIEEATQNNVALLNIEPDIQRGLIKGIAETKTTEDMITYIERLKEQQFFKLVVLTKHELNEQDVNKPVRFQFEAHWNKETTQ